jgi:hypothetical protein
MTEVHLMPARVSEMGIRIPKMEEIHQLETQLHDRLSGRVRDLHIFAQDRGLVLEGRAPTYYVKQLAQHVVMEATQYPILTNRIEVS